MKKRILTAILSAMVLTSSVILTACDKDKKTATPDEATPDSAVTATIDETPTQPITETVNNDVQKAITAEGLKVDEKGNVTDKDGNKVEKTSDGKVKVTTSDGQTVTVDTNTIINLNNSNNNNNTNKPNSTNKGNTTTNSNNNSSNKPSSNGSSAKPNTKTGGNSNTNKPNGGSSKPGNTASGNVGGGVYIATWYEAEYEYINHPAETTEVWVIDQQAYSYEEPVYEYQGRTICNGCGADITYNLEHVFDCLGSYHDEWVQVQVGTKTVNIPEKGHYETKVVKEAWTEKKLVREAGYY